VLKGVVSQQLIPRKDGGGRVAALEVMIANDAVANMIRESKCFQINSVIQTSGRQGMQSLDSNLAQLVKSGIIDAAAAMDKCLDKQMLNRFITG
jgi:twitching motility protein PilT